MTFLPLLGATPAYAARFPAANVPIGGNASYNWAGYVATGSGYTSVSGSWQIPSVTGPVNSADAAWIGIGGVSSADLIQAGTQTLVDSSGNAAYQAFYEILPNDSVTVNLPVRAGDVLYSSITQISTNQWQITLRNNTTGQSYQTTVQYASSENSVEWIEEMPSTSSGNYIPLDSFGSVSFTGDTVTQNGTTYSIAQTDAQPLTMYETAGNQLLATPSSLASDGEDFMVTRSTITSSSSSQTNPVQYNGGHWRQSSGMSSSGYSGYSHHRRSGIIPRNFMFRFRILY